MRQLKNLRIGDFTIGVNHPVFMIAEIGINHNGDLDRGIKLIRAAKKSGADAVKFQSFKADKICDTHLTETKSVEGITGGTKSSYDMYKALEVSDNMHKEFRRVAGEEGIMFFSSVFDEGTVDYLESLGVPAYKIASSDLTHIPLLKYAAQTGKPLLISTGMASMDEIESALYACYKAGNRDIAILHCVSCYPPSDDEVNLNSITSMRDRFSHPIGYSDHCEGTVSCLAACVLGANIIEKHFTLDNQWQGPDHKISSTADEFAELVKDIRRIEKMLGDGIKMPCPSELEGRKSSRRSIRALGDIAAGEIITLDKLIMLKPQIGLNPVDIDSVLGRRVKSDLKKHEPITRDKIE